MEKAPTACIHTYAAHIGFEGALNVEDMKPRIEGM